MDLRIDGDVGDGFGSTFFVVEINSSENRIISQIGLAIPSIYGRIHNPR